MVATLRVNEERMLAAATAGYTTATAVADALVELGVPFREGHHIVGSLVALAEAAGVELTELADRDIAAVLAASSDPFARGAAPDPDIAAALRAAARLENALARPDVIGGTAPRRVHAELAAAAVRLGIAD
jgi:argininosuccinate lyase